MAVLQLVPVVVLCSLALASLPVASALGRGGQNRRNDGNRGLQWRFYQRSCPNAERIVFSSMQNSYNSDRSIAPGVLRASFHDCFVRLSTVAGIAIDRPCNGCDGSLLLDGPNTERKSFANNFRQSTLDAIHAAKRAVEQACPGIVSCADVLQFAARDAVVLTGGRGWAVPAGRRDGRTSLASEANANLPGPGSKAPQLIAMFKNKGLSTEQMVTLSGAHTIGTASCVTIDNRQFATPRDPTLPLKLAVSLLRQCPKPRSFNRVAFDSTPQRFDPQYFVGVATGSGVLTSDVTLVEDPRTRRTVFANVLPFVFSRNFGDAMVAMSQIGVLTGSQGEIRRQIYQVNSP